LRNTDLKERFFEHLGHVGADAQFMVFENVDPAATISDYALVETFTNDTNNGRQGLITKAVYKRLHESSKTPANKNIRSRFERSRGRQVRDFAVAICIG
jgi:hypothetical protein